MLKVDLSFFWGEKKTRDLFYLLLFGWPKGRLLISIYRNDFFSKLLQFSIVCMYSYIFPSFPTFAIEFTPSCKPKFMGRNIA